MPLTATHLRYGFELDRDYFLDFMMIYDFVVPIVSALTLYPVIMYLLLFESKAMQRDIKIGYVLEHLALMLNEWSFCFFFRIYPLIPYAALYCEGPICNLGLNRHTLTTLLSIPVILINPPFNYLVLRMHQMLVSGNSKWKLSARTQIVVGVIHTSVMIANVFGFGAFGQDHDRADELKKEPDLAWLSDRPGEIFLFGPPGDPQYFRLELYILGSSIIIIAPPLIFLTAESMKIVGTTNDAALSQNTLAMKRRMYQVFLIQWMGATIHYIVPLGVMLLFMIIDTSSIPGWFYAPFRLVMLMIFTLNGHQFCIFFIIKNASYRKALRKRINPLVQLLPFCTVLRKLKPQKSSVLSQSSSVMEFTTKI